jgi:hypothetical protein
MAKEKASGDPKEKADGGPHVGVWDTIKNSAVQIIATHGLAVFLVLFYVFKMYPEEREERKAFLTELTELRRALSVDPEKRPLTAVQANAILEMQLDRFVHAVEEHERAPRPAGGTPEKIMPLPKEKEKPEAASYYFYKQRLGPDLSEAEVIAAIGRGKQVEQRHIALERMKVEERYVRTKIAGRELRFELRFFVTDYGSLDEIWLKAFEQHFEKLTQDLADCAVKDFVLGRRFEYTGLEEYVKLRKLDGNEKIKALLVVPAANHETSECLAIDMFRERMSDEFGASLKLGKRPTKKT